VQRRTFLWVAGAALCASPAAAATLSPDASRAFDERAERARQACVAAGDRPVAADASARARLRDGDTLITPATGDGIVEVPGALFHHWTGAMFMEGVTLDQVLALSRAYASYPDIFHPVERAAILSQQGDAYHVRFRMKESAGGMSATLDPSSIRYARPDTAHAYVISMADEIREVKDAGRSTERQLPAGEDSGYLWRAGSLTRFSADDDGVYMAMETLGLSRRFPPMLGWIIEPIARRIGRRSVGTSMDEFRRAVSAKYR
jgi:hypothetical protein